MDKINYHFIDVEIPDFDPEFFGLWITEIAHSYKRLVGDLSFVFCTDNYLLEINKKHLGHDYYTDIITFNYNEENSLSADVFISYDRIKDNAAIFSDGNEALELKRVIAHGILHLVGFNDKNEEEKKEMRKQEEKCLQLIVSRET
ncbi:MAG: rRNA maturation RNase YbeY [Crocinitomicaceae bacterium]